MCGEEEEEREREYKYKYINIYIKKKQPNVFGPLYIPTSLLIPFHKGLKALKLHGYSPSKFLRDIVIRFGEVHGEGNPQLLMETFCDLSSPTPIRVLCWSNLAGATSDGKIYCRKHGGMWIRSLECYSCDENQLRKDK